MALTETVIRQAKPGLKAFKMFDGLLSGTAVQYSRFDECFDASEAINHPRSIARALCSATVLLLSPVATARRRTPTRQLLPSGSMNRKCAESTKRVIGGGPCGPMIIRSQLCEWQ